MTEKDLYEPVKVFFESRGYVVKSEIKDCDVVCEKDGELIICELKQRINLELILQGVDRQHFWDLVYLAVFCGKEKRTGRKQKSLYQLLRRLSLGLLLIHGGEFGFYASAAIEAEKVQNVHKNNAKKKKVAREFSNRSGDYNIGGSTKTKIITYYRECAIFLLALLLENGGYMSPMQLVKQGARENTPSVLLKNAYGWFSHPARGLYGISQEGRKAFEDYRDIAQVLMKNRKKPDHLQKNE